MATNIIHVYNYIAIYAYAYIYRLHTLLFWFKPLSKHASYRPTWNQIEKVLVKTYFPSIGTSQSKNTLCLYKHGAVITSMLRDELKQNNG